MNMSFLPLLLSILFILFAKQRDTYKTISKCANISYNTILTLLILQY